jgi:hypothetical protein
LNGLVDFRGGGGKLKQTHQRMTVEVHVFNLVVFKVTDFIEIFAKTMD